MLQDHFDDKLVFHAQWGIEHHKDLKIAEIDNITNLKLEFLTLMKMEFCNQYFWHPTDFWNIHTIQFQNISCCCIFWTGLFYWWYQGLEVIEGIRESKLWWFKALKFKVWIFVYEPDNDPLVLSKEEACSLQFMSSQDILKLQGWQCLTWGILKFLSSKYR